MSIQKKLLLSFTAIASLVVIVGLIGLNKVISMARTLHMKIIAEGIETQAQKELLGRLGCRTMQGYLFSRPLSPDDMQGFLEQAAAVEQRHHSLL